MAATKDSKGSEGSKSSWGSKAPRPCSIADALALVGEKYSLLVLREVCMGNGRFDQLVRNIGAPRDILSLIHISEPTRPY